MPLQGINFGSAVIGCQGVAAGSGEAGGGTGKTQSLDFIAGYDAAPAARRCGVARSGETAAGIDSLAPARLALKGRRVGTRLNHTEGSPNPLRRERSKLQGWSAVDHLNT